MFANVPTSNLYKLVLMLGIVLIGLSVSVGPYLTTASLNNYSLATAKIDSLVSKTTRPVARTTSYAHVDSIHREDSVRSDSGVVLAINSTNNDAVPLGGYGHSTTDIAKRILFYRDVEEISKHQIAAITDFNRYGALIGSLLVIIGGLAWYFKTQKPADVASAINAITEDVLKEKMAANEAIVLYIQPFLDMFRLHRLTKDSKYLVSIGEMAHGSYVSSSLRKLVDRYSMVFTKRTIEFASKVDAFGKEMADEEQRLAGLKPIEVLTRLKQGTILVDKGLESLMISLKSEVDRDVQQYQLQGGGWLANLTRDSIDLVKYTILLRRYRQKTLTPK